MRLRAKVHRWYPYSVGLHTSSAVGPVQCMTPRAGFAGLSKNHLFVRYDGRGFGLSDRNVEDFSLDARVRDLEAVVDALGLERFALYGISAGGPTAIAYTVRHPERVSRLILAGTAAKVVDSIPKNANSGRE